jgi:hypothetical protein
MSENVGASTSRNPKGLHRDNFTFTFFIDQHVSNLRTRRRWKMWFTLRWKDAQYWNRRLGWPQFDSKVAKKKKFASKSSHFYWMNYPVWCHGFYECIVCRVLAHDNDVTQSRKGDFSHFTQYVQQPMRVSLEKTRNPTRSFASSHAYQDNVPFPVLWITASCILETTNKLRGFSPLANYTDRATAVCRRS